MKKIFIVFITGCLALCIKNDVQAQLWSTQAIFNPHSTTLVGDASRFGYHYSAWSTYYMRYNDSAYFCSLVYQAVTYATTTIIFPLDQDFIITDFKNLFSYQGFIGSYNDVGMFGRANFYKSSNNYPVPNSLDVFKLPAIDKLNRVAFIDALDVNQHSMVKAYAIGDKEISNGQYQSYILEFYAYGVNVFNPYCYALLPYDPVSHKQEIADDVIAIDKYVIFATRDTRYGHAPVNLRISDTTDALLNFDIDQQWQFWLPSHQIVISELRLIPLKDDNFVLAYIILDKQIEKYYLCTHKINLWDFLVENNTIIYHEVEIERDCTDLIDVIYEPDVNTMVFLLSGNGRSKLYHADPYATTNTYVSILNHFDGEFYSIDTIGDYVPNNADMYVAFGRNEFFGQGISNGMTIESSCLPKVEQKRYLKDSPDIERREEPIARGVDNKIHDYITKPGVVIVGQPTCLEPENQEFN